MALAFYPGTGSFRQKFFQFSNGLPVTVVLFLGVMLSSLPAVAAELAPANEVVAVLADTLIVRGSRAQEAIIPATGALVSRVDLDESTGARDAADLLDSVAGMQVRRYGGLGSSAVPSIRGSAAAQIRLFIDGMPLDDAQTGVVDLATLPLERFRSVDIHRGMVPAGLGGIGGAGALNFKTRDQDDGLDLKLFTGSFADRGGRLSWGGSTADGDRSGLIMIHGRQSDNDFEFMDPIGTFHRSDDDTLSVRRNAWVKEHGAWMTGSLQGGPGRIRTSLGFFRRDGGRPGMLGWESPHASVRYDRLDGRLGLGLLDDLFLFDFSSGRSREYLYDPEFEVGLLHASVTRSTSRDLGSRLLFSPVLWSGSTFSRVNELTLQAGLERRSQNFELWYDDDPDPERNRTVTAAFAQLDAKLLGDRLQLAPGWRWNRHRDNFPPSTPIAMPWLPEQEGVIHVRDTVSPSFGLVWSLVPGELYLESHSSRSHRVPTWTELFGHRGGIDGNRDLLPEEITTGDLALSVRSPGGKFWARSAVFLSSAKQTIVYIQNSQGTSKAVNAGASRTTGVELEATLRLRGSVRVQGNLTLQQARDRSGLPEYDGKDLPYLPDHQAWLKVDGLLGTWRPRLELTAVGRNYRDRYNTELNRPGARFTLNLGLARNWTGNWADRWVGPAGRITTELEFINLTDNRIFDLEGFPLPGRSIHLAFRMKK